MSVIWGMPYLLIRIAVRDVSPPTLIFLRTAPAALVLLPVALRRGALGAVRRHLGWILAYTVAELGVPWLFVSRAEVDLTSSLTGLLIATVPLTGAVLYALLGVERLDLRRVAGLLVGFGGVAVLVGADLHAVDLGAVVEVVVPAMGYAVGPLIISRKLADLPGLGVITASLLMAGVAYAPWGLTHWPTRWTAESAASVAGLALITTALAFVLFFELILEVGPSRSTVITYVNPAVAILLGVVVLGEPFTVGIALGFPLILAGSWLATSHRGGDHAAHDRDGGSGADGRADGGARHPVRRPVVRDELAGEPPHA